MNSKKWLFVISFALLAAACKDKPAQGPAEKAGEKLDQAAEDTKEGAKDVKEDLQDGTKKKD